MRFLLAPDLSAPTGGNRYDRELLDRVEGLTHVRAQDPDRLPELPAGSTVLLDGLVASAFPDALAAHARRLRLVLLVHLLRADDDRPGLLADEVRSLRLVDTVVVTSRSSARRVREVAGVEAVVAEPGTDPAPPSAARGAHRLLCVGTVGERKGQRLVAEAVQRLGAPWSLRCAGRVEEGFTASGTRLLGPVEGVALQREWDRTDLHVLLSAAEPYGMAVAEGLRRGVPSLVSAEGELPSLVADAGLVVPRTVDAVADALRGWSADARVRHRLRRAALARNLPTWAQTAQTVERVL
ncbi:glycosyltransferase family 4 protein [Kineococcus rhizosphaerae]|uniref:Glycosyl transferase family 1 n=1 Tax=Kineococcus rhizosphaerae TaxID=559628 RepID=A0A2T0RAY1_9ACTN|nr:glycosyltransferase family 4 protein [Kineococcus rhizosphaerae]PRY18322.1 glycosyl transferase family 1 [Kineococcus rhizosphaerae]